jgi:para-nitrobenzyl esterase
MRTFLGGLAVVVTVGCGSDRESDFVDAGPTADAGPNDNPAVQTTAGPVGGLIIGDTRIFLGIPYVAPPVGDLRWTHPRPHEPWTTTLNATARGAVCPQPDLNTGELIGDEDCLTLNIWAPRTHAAPLPVMVWLHGGGYFVGSGGDPTYDGAQLSSVTGNIVVTINYRLGSLGFFSDPALTAADPTQPTSGNYGFEDQRAALEWVHDNIANFGGDPAQVTLMGESAGGEAVCHHLGSPRSAGLFVRAIMESGDCAVAPADFVATQSQTLLTNLGCDGTADAIACARAKTVAEIMDGTDPAAIFGPEVDGFDLPDDPLAMLARGDIASKVPLLNGNNADEEEFSFGLGFLPPVTDEASYTDLLSMLFAGSADAVVAFYPSADYASPHAAAVQALTDAFDICPNRTILRALAATGVPLFTYEFKHAFASPAFPDGGAFHSSEVAFVFGTSQWGGTLDADERVLSRTMMGYWGRFAATADPAGTPAWPAYGDSEDRLVLDLTLSTVTHWRSDACDFWDGLSSAGGRARPPSTRSRSR